MNSLLHIAEANIGDAAGTYVGAEGAAASSDPGFRADRLTKGFVNVEIMYNSPAMMAHAADRPEMPARSSGRRYRRGAGRVAGGWQGTPG